MARLAGMAGLSGSMGGVSVYKMRGVDQLVVRQKGGASRDRIRRDKNFEITRRHNGEWKACVAAGKQIIFSIHAIKHLADYNYSGSLMAICKSIQQDDPVNPLGLRSVLLSQYAYKLEGFGLNQYNSFESIVKHPLHYSIDRSSGSAVVQLPELVPGVNLGNPLKQPLYRVVITFGAVADVVYDEMHNRYEPVTAAIMHPVTAATGWCPYKQTMPATVLTASLDAVPADPQVSLVLAVGIEFGVPVSNTEVRPVKYAGAAKVVRVG